MHLVFSFHNESIYVDASLTPSFTYFSFCYKKKKKKTSENVLNEFNFVKVLFSRQPSNKAAWNETKKFCPIKVFFFNNINAASKVSCLKAVAMKN